jgi:5-methylcytosine-specific restriction endonuclease McrA
VSIRRPTRLLYAPLIRHEVARVYGSDCFYCEKPTREDAEPNAPDRATMDHLLPRKEGGLTKLKNLRIACLRCNNERGSHDMLKFMKRKGRCTDLRKNFDLAHTLYEVAALHGLIES